jgi:hypothetical protein
VWSRRLAAAQAIATVEAGGRSVSLAAVLGPDTGAPALMFGPDRFHPSAAGYASLAQVLLPSVLAAVGVVPIEELVPEAARGEAILPIGEAAVEAARTAGTEIDGTRIDGSELDAAGDPRGQRGRWVQLRRRRRHPEADVESPEVTETVVTSGA